jgi:hypothetical protein
LDAVLSARKLLASLQPISLPVPIERYAHAVDAVIRHPDDLQPDEPGFSFQANGKWYICVNPADSPGRRRFTVCHEVGHIRLDIPSAHHHAMPAWNFAKKSTNELICDRFASELLLPQQVLKPMIERMPIGMQPIQDLAARFETSLTATLIAFVTNATATCALIVSHGGTIRYALCSTSLRSAGAWISGGGTIPRNSVSSYAGKGNKSEGPESAEPDDWFANWRRGGGLMEDAIYVPAWDQTVTLLWFEDEEIPPPRRDRADRSRDEDDNDGLEPLSGVLHWPSRSRRR